MNESMSVKRDEAAEAEDWRTVDEIDNEANQPQPTPA